MSTDLRVGKLAQHETIVCLMGNGTFDEIVIKWLHSIVEVYMYTYRERHLEAAQADHASSKAATRLATITLIVNISLMIAKVGQTDRQ